jgi:hypothetical protein
MDGMRKRRSGKAGGGVSHLSVDQDRLGSGAGGQGRGRGASGAYGTQAGNPEGGGGVVGRGVRGPGFRPPLLYFAGTNGGTGSSMVPPLGFLNDHPLLPRC